MDGVFTEGGIVHYFIVVPLLATLVVGSSQ
jgi:hypothetical protein